jgi:predicted transcriptional regulator
MLFNAKIYLNAEIKELLICNMKIYSRKRTKVVKFERLHHRQAFIKVNTKEYLSGRKKNILIKDKSIYLHTCMKIKH